jgi:hypothetical protein
LSDNNFFKEIAEGFREGRDSELEESKKDTAPVGEKVVDGVIEGLVNAMLSPIEWLKRFFDS